MDRGEADVQLRAPDRHRSVGVETRLGDRAQEGGRMPAAPVEGSCERAGGTARRDARSRTRRSNGEAALCIIPDSPGGCVRVYARPLSNARTERNISGLRPWSSRCYDDVRLEGSSSSIPNASKSRVLQVTRVNPWTSAVAAKNASMTSGGRPALLPRDIDHTPGGGHTPVDVENAPFEPGRQILLQPALQPVAPMPRRPTARCRAGSPPERRH